MSGEIREDEWLRVAAGASRFATPFYLIWSGPYEARLARLNEIVAPSPLPVRHWYSYKSLPVPHMALVARSHGLGIEVVSRFELAAALRLGFPASDILVNGVAKHSWLADELIALNVVFDSLAEVERLAPVARKLQWKIGLRVAVSGQRDPDDTRYPAQFGIAPDDIAAALALLRQNGVNITILHVHLRSNVPTTEDYRRAAEELATIVATFDMAPAVIDLGGGLPEQMIGIGGDVDARFDWNDFTRCVAVVARLFPSACHLWLENGRHLLGPAGALVVTVQDVKRIDGWRFLICDGGRTNQALESEGCRHKVATLAQHAPSGGSEPTVICGPTCMAYDWLWRGEFAADVRIGERLVYLNAGAYHLSWESRFSHGLTRIVWTTDGRRFAEIRAAETADHWRSDWR